MLNIFRPKLNKSRILPTLRSTISEASGNLGLSGSNEALGLELNALKLLDMSAPALSKENGWNIKWLNEHCRPEILASFTCYCSFRFIRKDEEICRSIVKEGVKVALRMLDIYDDDTPIRKIELAVVLTMVKQIRKQGLEEEDFIGFKSGFKSGD